MIPTDTRLACQDPDLLWAYSEAVEGREVGIRTAIEACQGCTVQAECLTMGRALKAHGVWGGVLLETKRYDQGDVCAQGHSLVGRNGRRRNDGTRVCRACETDTRHRREART